MVFLNIKNGKNKLRKDLIEQKFSMDIEMKRAADFSIKESLSRLSVIKHANRIALYCAFGNEVDLREFAAERIIYNQILCFPRSMENLNDNHYDYEMAEITNFSDLKKGRFGILEPCGQCKFCKKEKIDVWLVPGLLFAFDGTRLGRGAGVYDRLLQDSPGKKIGVLYNYQLKETLPSENHDVKMDMMITETEFIRVGKNKNPWSLI